MATMHDGGYVYILASKGKRLYTGVTSELMLRVEQHKKKKYADSFTAQYDIDQLVYYQHYELMVQAIARESAIKNMSRLAKITLIALIVAINPTWQDLSRDWGKQAAAFDESKMMPPTTF